MLTLQCVRTPKIVDHLPSKLSFIQQKVSICIQTPLSVCHAVCHRSHHEGLTSNQFSWLSLTTTVTHTGNTRGLLIKNTKIHDEQTFKCFVFQTLLLNAHMKKKLTLD